MNTFSEHPLSGKKDIDSAFSSGWEFYRKWFVPLFTISFIMALITAGLTSKFDISSISTTSSPDEIISLIRPMIKVYLLIALISLVFNTLLNYFIIYKPLDKDFSFSDAIVKVITRYYIPLLVVFIILAVFSFVAIALGMLLLFIGMFFAIPYILLFFAMATPLMIIENTSIGETISKLISLVHNRFWSNMGWISIYVLLIIFFSIIAGALIMLPFSGSLFKSFSDPESAGQLLTISSNPLYIILSSLVSAVTTPILPILGLILYFGNSDPGNSQSGTGNEKGRPGIADLYSAGKNDKNQNNDPDDTFRPTVDDLKP